MDIKTTIDRLRSELTNRIGNAVSQSGGCIGIYYYNMGIRHKECPGEEATGELPAVEILSGTGVRTQTALLIELYIERNSPHVMCLVNDEAGNDTEVPLDRLTIESLGHIHGWLTKHEFLAEDTLWRCRRCGSSDVEEQVWIAVNTGEKRSTAQNRDEFYCSECDSHDRLTTEGELMDEIERWITKARSEDFGACPESAGERVAALPEPEKWNSLTTEGKIAVWSKHNNI